MHEIYFVDTSALSKRYISETGTSWLHSILNSPSGCTIYISRITSVELISAITRRERSNSFTLEDAELVRNAFRQHLSMEYNVIEVSEMLSESAMRLAEKHGLRGCDSIQLASALEANSSYLSAGLKGAEFISSDAELNAAALIEGLVVSNPNAHP